MKVSLPKDSVIMTTKAPLLPLVPVANDAMTKDNSNVYTLRTDPADANSPTYKMTARILFGNESVRVMIRWRQDLYRVLEGLNVTTVRGKVRMAEQMLRDTPYALFTVRVQRSANAALDRAVRNAADAAAKATLRAAGSDPHLTDDMFKEALDYMFENLMPKKTLQRVKRYLRRECRKPADMKVRTYFQHLTRINGEEISSLPPFAANQELTADEIVDIILYGVPKSWIREMDRQGFDPMDSTPGEVVDFLEQIETAEDFDGGAIKAQAKDGNGQNNKSKGNNSTSKGGSSKGDSKQAYCLLHGKGNHSSDQCTALKAQAAKLKSGTSSGNNKWSRKAADGKKKSQKELNALIKKTVQEEVNAIAKSNKKRKSEDGEINMLDDAFNDIDLSAYDYTKLDEKLDSKSDDMEDDTYSV